MVFSHISAHNYKEVIPMYQHPHTVTVKDVAGGSHSESINVPQLETEDLGSHFDRGMIRKLNDGAILEADKETRATITKAVRAYEKKVVINTLEAMTVAGITFGDEDGLKNLLGLGDGLTVSAPATDEELAELADSE
jgi:hypothetical protein